MASPAKRSDKIPYARHHVDVDDIDAFGLDDRGRVIHAIGIAAVDLDRHGPLGFAEPEHLVAAVVLPRQSFRRDELRNDEPDASQLLDQRPIVRIGHLGHGRESQRRIDADAADVEGPGKPVHVQDRLTDGIRIQFPIWSAVPMAPL